MARHGRSNSVSLLLGCAGLLFTHPVFAQQAQPAPGSGQPSKTKVVRRPIVDLKKQAQDPRPGQVLPGQPQPPPPESVPDAAPPERATQPAATPAAAQPAPTVVPAAEQPVAEPPAATTPAPPAATVPAQQQPVTPPPAAELDSVKPVVPAAPQPEAVRPVDLPNTTQPAATRTPAAKVTKPLKPAPIPVTAETKPAPAPPVPPPPAESAPVAPVAEPKPQPESVPVTTPAAEPLVESSRPEVQVGTRAHETADARAVDSPSPDTAPVTQIEAAPLGEPIQVQVTSVEGPPDVMQLRVDGGEWKHLTVNDKVEGRVSLRTGLGAAATVTLADQVTVRVSRLSRVRFEQRLPQKAGMPVELVVELTRGEVDIKPLPMVPGGPAPAVVRVITPDKNFTTRLATGVRFDAFSGTRLKLVGGEK